jgi:hypothetical protein
MRAMLLLVLSALQFAGALATAAETTKCRRTCVVKSSGSNETDDAPAIRQAFKDCGRQAKVTFLPTTYYVNSVLNITGLEDVEIDLRGTLLVSDKHTEGGLSATH